MPKFKERSLYIYLFISITLHIFVILFFIVGPVMFKSHKNLEKVISVDIVNISNIKNIKPMVKKEADEVIINKSPKKQVKEKEEIEQVEERVEKTKPEKSKEIEKKIKPVEVKKKEVTKIEKESKKKSEEKPKKKPKRKNLDSLLKNLEKNVSDKDKKNKDLEEGKEDIDIEQYDESLSLSITEIDYIRNQIQKYWDIPAGARGIGNMSVEFKITINPDCSVGAIEMVDSVYESEDSGFFGAFSDSGVRAIRRSDPFRNMDPNKCNNKDVLLINFDPKQMFD